MYIYAYKCVLFSVALKKFLLQSFNLKSHSHNFIVSLTMHDIFLKAQVLESKDCIIQQKRRKKLTLLAISKKLKA